MDWLLPVRPVDETGRVFEVEPHSALLGTFGSFLMACAVRAASTTVDGKELTSLRADFLTPPPAGVIGFEVETTRSGGSVAVRRVVVGVGERHAVMTLSYATPERDGAATSGTDRGRPFDEDPESLDRYEGMPAGLAVLDARPLEPTGSGYVRRHPFWARPAEPFGDGPVASAAAIALASDHFVTALAAPRSEGSPGFAVTLDHSIWFHRPTSADEWLRYEADLVSQVGGRAVMRGTVWTAEGNLAASFMQQAMRRELKGR